MTRTEINDPRKWRVSMSGFSIKTGWGDEKSIITQYPGAIIPSVDPDQYKQWLTDAEHICFLYNAELEKPHATGEET